MEKNMKNKKSKARFLFKIEICLALLFAVFLSMDTSYISWATEDNNFCYLSDLPLDSENCNEKSRVGWGSITRDQNLDTKYNQGLISLIVDGKQKRFLKGISAHANSILIFDIADLDYDYFSTYFGVDASRGKNGNGVWFKICTKTDYNGSWKQEGTNSETKKGNTEAGFVTIDIRGKKLLKLEAYCRNGQDSAHACYANAKFYKEGFENEGNRTVDYIKTVEEYDAIIKAHDGEAITGEYELAILQRDLVNKIGYDILQGYTNLGGYKEKAFASVFKDAKNLSLFTTGGKPEGSYIKSFDVLAKLLEAHEADLSNTTLIDANDSSKGTLGDLYKRMMYSIALTHSGNIYLWITGGNSANNPVERYEIYKDLYAENLIQSRIFETLKVEELRWLMNTVIDNEEIKWLNNYTRTKKNGATGPYSYIRYTFGYNYNKDQYYDPANYEKWDAKYELSKYNITYKKGRPKLWIVFEEGSVCGGLSKTGSCVWGSFKGLPNTCTSQPGHCAYIYYNKNAQGKGVWGLGNDVSGWAQTGRTEHLNTCIPLDWGDEEYINFNADWLGSATYVLLAQGALNDYDNYVESKKTLMMSEIYKAEANQATGEEKVEKLHKLETIYEKALEAEPINIDAWYGLIKAYRMDTSKKEKDFYSLAERIFNELKYYPLPMYHLEREIKKNLTEPEYVFKFTMGLQKTLTEAKNATDAQTIQKQAVRQVAQRLLGITDSTLATFSFDGADAGAIKISNRFDGSDVRWDYSLDGKQTWTATSEHKQPLTPEELASITAENDIYVHIVGVNYDESNLYKIDIQPTSGLPSTLYANDWENKFMGTNSNMQWKYRPEDEWTYFSEREPDLTGNKSATVRVAATGLYLASDEATYEFTENNDPDTEKYIPINHLSIHGYSTQSRDTGRPFYAPNAIDGNANTLWHTDFGQNVLQQPIKPFISIKLDEPKNISAVEFIQKKYSGKPNDPDNIRNLRAYVSIDGESWAEAGRIENCDTYGQLYKVAFDKSAYGQYVKLEMDTTNMFASLAMVNLYEDTTVVTLGTFSFDGANAGKIMLVDEFKGSRWEYSLDAGTTWKNGKGDEHLLTAEEIAKINADHKIKLRLNNKESTIQIQRQEVPVITAYLNDLENRLIGIVDTSKLEWRIEPNTEIAMRALENKTWTSYSEQEPIVPGDTKLFIRKKATGMLVASEPVEFTFTEDNQPDTAKYVPIKHITSVNASNTTVPSRGEEANFAIDGLPTTMWHSNRTTTTMHDPRWIVLELDEPIYLSKLEYVKKSQYAYGVPRDGKVLVSMDGENWTEVYNFENLYDATTAAELTASEDRKMLELSKIEEAKFVKVECTKSCDSVHGERNGEPMDYFFAAAMINLFEDTTKIIIPTAEVEYSTTELTNQDVTATLVNKSTNITVTNNNGSDTYTFTDNGEFTFEFVDNKGNRGTATAKVDWICKTLPVPTITYSEEALTNEDVTATVTFDRDVKILDEADQEIETVTTGNAYTYVFTENGSHEIRFVGPYGNEGRTTLAVDWIDKKVPTANITYSSTNVSNQDVTATITFDEENVTVKDGKTHTFTENGEYTFEFEDAAGNSGTATATVSWIDRSLPVANITYSTTSLTNEDVTATVTFTKDGVSLDNVTVEGGNTHTFEKNGTYEFNFVTLEGNAGVAVAKVDWIDKEAPIGTITYSNNNLTNGDVTATITFNEEDVRITNNGGKNTYTFEMNGEFEFEFVDKAGNTGTETAVVEWIDKREINATIDYDIRDITNQDVTATITFDKENVTILNNDGKNTYTFTENGRFEFKFIGPAGNAGTATAEVSWIDKTPPAATVSYSTKELTNQDVTATVTFDEGGVTIVNEKGEPIENGDTHVFTKNGTYTFYYVGPLGNKGTAVAKVDWIAKEVPKVRIQYSTKELTNQNVVATLMCVDCDDGENIIITNNNGKNEYIFTKNGTFTFEFVDKAGNKGTAEAMVDWIVEENEPDDPKEDDDPIIDNPSEDDPKEDDDPIIDNPSEDDPKEDDDPIIDNPSEDDPKEDDDPIIDNPSKDDPKEDDKPIIDNPSKDEPKEDDKPIINNPDKDDPIIDKQEFPTGAEANEKNASDTIIDKAENNENHSSSDTNNNATTTTQSKKSSDNSANTKQKKTAFSGILPYTGTRRPRLLVVTAILILIAIIIWIKIRHDKED